MALGEFSRPQRYKISFGVDPDPDGMWVHWTEFRRWQEDTREILAAWEGAGGDATRIAELRKKWL